jgi:hypothetical protein
LKPSFILIWTIVAVLSAFSVSAYPYTSSSYFDLDGDSSIKSISIGNKVITLNGVSFVCKNTPIPPIRQETPSYLIRTPPKGNFDQSCTCVRQSVSTSGTCAEWSCQTIIDEQNNPSCWILKGSFLNKNELIYNQLTEINPYITASYTTNAEWTNKIKNNHNVALTIDIDVKNGITTSIESDPIISSNEEIIINYNNKIMDGLKGYIEIKQLNGIFLVFSKVDKIPVTFNRGTGTVKFTLDNVVGNKNVEIVPVVQITEQPSNTIIDFVGTMMKTTSKVALKHATDISDTEPFILPKQLNGTTSDNSLSIWAKINLWISSFNQKIEGMFNG